MSADGKILVSGGKDKTIKVWEMQTGKLKKTLQSDSGAINALAIAPDGKTVVSPDGKFLAGITSDSNHQNTRIKVLQPIKMNNDIIH